MEFQLKYQDNVGDLMSSMIPQLVDPLLQYAIDGGGASIKEVAYSAIGKITGMHGYAALMKHSRKSKSGAIIKICSWLNVH